MHELSGLAGIWGNFLHRAHREWASGPRASCHCVFVGKKNPKSDLCFCTASGRTNETYHLGEIKQAPPKVIISNPWLFLYNRESLCNGNEMIYTPKFWPQHLESLIHMQVELVLFQAVLCWCFCFCCQKRKQGNIFSVVTWGCFPTHNKIQHDWIVHRNIQWQEMLQLDSKNT